MVSTSNDIITNALTELIQILISDQNPDKEKIESLKRTIAKKYGLNRFVRNSEILDHVLSLDTLTETTKDHLTQLLQTRQVRTVSGIAVVAVMTKPSPCPGNCIYCPDVPSAPKSYTGREPAAMRGIQNEFIPKKQVTSRLSQLKSIGHPLDKIHLVIMGGTFLATPLDYQKHFVKECLDGITKSSSKTLEMAKISAMKSQYRNVGITIETRPDYCTPKYVNRILELGGTWTEIGAQTLSEDILKRIQRHHTIEDLEIAIRSAKNGGLKVTVHMMPNLFQTPEEDIVMFEKLYTDPRFIPDAIKIYPTLVLPGTKLFDMWKKGTYVPYNSKKVSEVIAAIKEITPPFVRIQRVQRDIPAYLIVDGVRYGNLREIARKRLAEKGKKCNCIRCREVGHQTILGDLAWIEKEKKFFNSEYQASKGTEHFLSFETSDKNTIFGFLRLRQPSKHTFLPEAIDDPLTIIRELHVYGKLVGIGKIPKEYEEWQHRGIGQKLIELAEEISIERGFRKIFVTSGLGVKDYYRKLGYEKFGPYMAKSL